MSNEPICSAAADHRQEMEFASGLKCSGEALPREAMIDGNLQTGEQIAPLAKASPDAGKTLFQPVDRFAHCGRGEFDGGGTTGQSA